MSRSHGIVGKVFGDRGFIETGDEDFYFRGLYTKVTKQVGGESKVR